MPIYVDDQFRKSVIPVGVMNVEVYYSNIAKLDKYEVTKTVDVEMNDGIVQVKQVKENSIIKEIREKIVGEREKRRREKADSFLEKMPYLKAEITRKSHNLPAYDKLDDSDRKEALYELTSTNKKRTSHVISKTHNHL